MRPRLRRRKGARPHLPRNALHCAGANTTFASHLENALAGPQMTLDSLFEGWSNLRAPELLTLLHGPLKPGVTCWPIMLRSNSPKGPRNLKHQLPPTNQRSRSFLSASMNGVSCIGSRGAHKIGRPRPRP